MPMNISRNSATARSLFNESATSFSARLRAVMSYTQLIAPVISPLWFFSGRMFTTAVTRVPSGRSMTTSASRASDNLPRRTSAIGHWSCGMKLPSGRNILNEPQNRSSGSSTAGSRPHNATA